MTAVVTGASGHVGNNLVRELLARGHTVRAIIRPASPLPDWADKAEIHLADLRGGSSLAAAFEGVDALVHAAALLHHPHLIPQLIAIIFNQRIRHRLKIPANNLIQLINRKSNPMIG